MPSPSDFDPPFGTALPLGGDIRRILAPNPSPMTWRGTNTYLVGRRGLAVIDPGPDNEAHFEAILRAVQPGQRITHILVSHAHLDHSPLAAPLAAATGAAIHGFGPADAGRSPVMQNFARSGLARGGEGVDHGFAPDIALPDGSVVSGDGWRITAHWTPGHFGNHLCFQLDRDVFSGDLVMGWASSLVSPPDGDLSDYMASCRRIMALGAHRLLPGHGAPVCDPAARIEWLLAHRQAREAAILAALKDGAADATTLAKRIYTDTPAPLLPAAARNVLAHLIDLYTKDQITPITTLSANAQFRLCG